MKNITICFLLIILNVGCLGKKKPGENTKNNHSQFILVNGVDATHESFNEVASVFGKTTDHEIALGVGFIISYFRMSPDDAAARLRKYLSLSEAFDLPVIVQLD